MHISRNNNLVKEIVLVDGMGRTGKFYISNLISTYNRVEISRLDNVFDLLPKLWKMKKIDMEATVAYLRIEADLGLYNNMLGRNINFRKEDYSSIYKCGNKNKYKNRIEKKRVRVEDDVLKQKPIFQSVSHDILSNVDPVIEAFQDKLKIIHVIRNPIDIIYSWYYKGLIDRIGCDPTDLDLTYFYKGVNIPIYCYNPKDYLKLNYNERIISIVDYCFRENINGYLKLQCRDRIKILDINYFNDNKIKTSKSLEEFLNTSSTLNTKIFLKKKIEKSKLERKDKLDIIEDNLGDIYRHKLNNLLRLYIKTRENYGLE